MGSPSIRSIILIALVLAPAAPAAALGSVAVDCVRGALVPAEHRKLHVSPDGRSVVSTAEDWIERGVDIELPQRPSRSLEKSVQMQRELDHAGLADFKLQTFLNLPNLTPDLAAEAVVDGYSKGLDPSAFKNLFGIDPTPRNLSRLRAIMKHYPAWEVSGTVYRFPKYQELDALPSLPAEVPEAETRFLEGVRDLWNKPREVVNLIREVRERVERALVEHPGASAESALEGLRVQLERANGFLPGVTNLRQILSTRAFGDELARGHALRDSQGSHSLERLPRYGQNRHRDQRLVILLARLKSPERFGGSEVSAAQVFRRLGNLSWNASQPIAYENGVGLLQNGPWYYLFDQIGTTGRAEVANMANPIYFGEIWENITGFKAWW